MLVFHIVVMAQLAVAAPANNAARALDDFITLASAANHRPPPSLASYHATVETELSLLIRDTLGRERAGQIEQLASTVTWNRGNDYLMHVVGYRSQSAGPPFSTLSLLRGWTEPFLYGERLVLGAQFVIDTARMRKDREKRGMDTIIAVHPLATDRNFYYTYSGGDTITTLRTQARAIPIVRIRVIPHLKEGTRFAAFDGEMDLDADRHQIVRMRGQFVVLGKRKGRTPLIARMPGLVAVAYSEFVNAEVNGRYWLPAFQRTEFQTSVVLLGRDRAVIRMVSRFSNFKVDESGISVAGDSSITRVHHTTTWAPSDSITKFGNWEGAIGDATTNVAADDFDDLAPDAWKPNGKPTLDLAPTTLDNLLRYNRVEGLFAGLEANVRMRDAFPGLSLGATAGWAWTERTARGEVHGSLHRGLQTFGMRAGRELASTNEFILPGESGRGGIGGAFGSFDDFDYVDRRFALASVTHVFGSVNHAVVTFQGGVRSDQAELSRLQSGLIGGGTFRPNRGSDNGNYTFGSIDLEIHPNNSGEFVQSGVGARLHHEIGSGDLNWQRSELSLMARKYWGPIALTLHSDAGAVFGSRIPPQQLFELGGSVVLPGYDYKEFAGDRGALFRSFASYTLPIWRAPHRIWRTIYLPGIAPGFAAGFQGGWTTLSSRASRDAVKRLGGSSSSVTLSRPTGGVRATFGAGLTLFSGAAHFGFARPVDHPAAWKVAIGFGASF